MSIKDNLNEVLASIEEACLRANRDPKEVTLVAVSKTKPVSDLMEAYDAGIRDFGENYVQELVGKIEEMPKDIRWHMIGHLQTNKVKYIVGKVHLIHSVDSLKLAKEIDKQAEKLSICQDILIEVNAGEEESKFGLSLEDTIDMIRDISKLNNVHIRGLMTSAPYVDDFNENLSVFHKIFQLSVDTKGENIDNVDMDLLSMGMSQDYIAAIYEGANLVRVGSKIFGARNYNK